MRTILVIRYGGGYSLLYDVLVGTGDEVISHCDAASFHTIHSVAPPSLIIVDLAPDADMDVVALARVYGHPPFAQVPVLLCLGNSQEPSVYPRPTDTEVEVLRKPFELEELRGKITALLGDHVCQQS